MVKLPVLFIKSVVAILQIDQIKADNEKSIQFGGVDHFNESETKYDLFQIKRCFTLINTAHHTMRSKIKNVHKIL